MQLKDQIDLIINARKEKSEGLKQRKEKLLEIKGYLKDISSGLCAQAKTIKDEKLRIQYIGLFGSLDSRNAQKYIDQAIRKMDEGAKRFERDYISIATVGKERQGKSEFLKSVGNLKNEIIPAYDGTSCTGATSIIWNDSKMSAGTVRATISFRQPQDLLGIVQPYIQELDPEYLADNPLTFEEIGYINIPLLETKMVMGNAVQASALKHLTNIVEHFDEIRDLFGASPLTLMDPELIKTYVAQNNGKSESDPDLERYYSYLAVARADIYCPFYSNVGKIRLVDTVGIGDTKFGIEDAMLNTVDTECDAAIVVTRPISGIQTGDQDLYTSLRNKFAFRDTKRWLFYLVNHFVGQNDNTVEAFYKEVKDQKWSVADCRIVDAHDQVKVQDDFLMPMLQVLVHNMEDIDRDYLREIDKLEEMAMAEINRFLDKQPELESINTNSLLGKEAFEKGKRCFNRMTAELKKVVFYWNREKEKDNSILWNQVQKIVNNLDDIIPTAEELQAISDNNGSLTGNDVWEKALHHVRNEITDRFIVIDDVLEKATLDFKNSLVKSLYDELRVLSAGSMSETSEEQEVDMVEWLKTMMDGILSSNEQYEQIRKAFNFMYKFEFNTRAQLIQEVRRQMYIINPICNEYAKPAMTFHSENCGDAVHFYLTSRMSVIEDELRFQLSKLYRTPNMAFYAAAEEFYDRLTFASNMNEEALTSMSDIWGSFFQEYSSKIWQADTERYEEVNKLIQRYEELIEKLNESIGKEAA